MRGTAVAGRRAGPQRRAAEPAAPRRAATRRSWSGRPRAVREQEAELAAEVERRRAGARARRGDRASEAERRHAEEERRLAALLRAAADRREGLARLHGQVNALRSRAAAAEAEIGRLTRGPRTRPPRGPSARSTSSPRWRPRSPGSTPARRASTPSTRPPSPRSADPRTRLAKLREEAQARRARARRPGRPPRGARARPGPQGRRRRAAGRAPTGRRAARLGRRAAHRRPGYEAAVAAALGAAADAVAVADLDAALAALDLLKDEDPAGPALLLGGAAPTRRRRAAGRGLPAGAPLRRRPRRAAPTELRPRCAGCSPSVAVVDDLAPRSALVADAARARPRSPARATCSARTSPPAARPRSPACSRSRPRSTRPPQQLAEATAHAASGSASSIAQLESERRGGRAAVDVALAQLHESDATLAAVAEQLGQLGSQRALGRAARPSGSARDRRRPRRPATGDLAGLAELEQRLAARRGGRRRGARHRRARPRSPRRRAPPAQPRWRPGSRCAPTRSAAGPCRPRRRAARAAAEAEREARARAIARRERLRPRGPGRPRRCGRGRRDRAGPARGLARPPPPSAQRRRGSRRGARARQLLASRGAGCATLAAELDKLVRPCTATRWPAPSSGCGSSSWRSGRSRSSASTPDALVAEYGPDQLVPRRSSPDDDGATTGAASRCPYVRERAGEAAARRRARAGPARQGQPAGAGGVRGAGGAAQVPHRAARGPEEDPRATCSRSSRRSTSGSSRSSPRPTTTPRGVRRVFARLFPGGEGRLVLTDPDNMLTTGVEVEARPPGKKVKRLSLLSGGERSLVAVAFLVALFKARPSPFYILDEVEAALDDTNLGRLLEIYEELRENSQLIVITHQKRTMEVADALYGVSMRGDGVSTVISQRLREAERA